MVREIIRTQQAHLIVEMVGVEPGPARDHDRDAGAAAALPYGYRPCVSGGTYPGIGGQHKPGQRMHAFLNSGAPGYDRTVDPSSSRNAARPRLGRSAPSPNSAGG